MQLVTWDLTLLNYREPVVICGILYYDSTSFVGCFSLDYFEHKFDIGGKYLGQETVVIPSNNIWVNLKALRELLSHKKIGIVCVQEY